MKTKYMKIFNIFIVIISILIFELGYCNHTFVKELIINKQITPFHISLCRGIIYIIIIIITLIFNKKNNFEETIELLNTKDFNYNIYNINYNNGIDNNITKK